MPDRLFLSCDTTDAVDGDRFVFRASEDALPNRIVRAAGTVRTVATSQVVLASDEVLFVDTTAGDVTITLRAAQLGRPLWIKKKVAAHSVIIQRAGSDTIDGATSVTLTTQYQTARFAADGVSAWGAF